jgi:hypothetical protein
MSVNRDETIKRELAGIKDLQNAVTSADVENIRARCAANGVDLPPRLQVRKE